MAWWESWFPHVMLRKAWDAAAVRLASAKSRWAVTYGPFAAMYNTTCRLGWTMQTACTAITDAGLPIDFRLDSPAFIKEE
eukprot:1576122-Karenia_brevis.AAC.1